jgi:hypothetical protein
MIDKKFFNKLQSIYQGINLEFKAIFTDEKIVRIHMIPFIKALMNEIRWLFFYMVQINKRLKVSDNYKFIITIFK